MSVRKLFHLLLITCLSVSVVLMAGCAPEEYEVEIQADPEEAGEIEGEGTYEEGEEVVVEAEPDEGYEFEGWYLDEEQVSQDQEYEFEIEEDSELKAELEIKEYEVKLETEEDKGTLKGEGIYEHGETITVEAEPDEGYEFKKWEKDNEKVSSEPDFQLEVKEDAALEAQFEIAEYEVSLQYNEEKGEVGGSGTYEEGEEIKIEAEPEEGYEFVRWMESEEWEKVSDSKKYTFNVEKNKEFVPQFMPPYAAKIQNDLQEVIQDEDPEDRNKRIKEMWETELDKDKARKEMLEYELVDHELKVQVPLNDDEVKEKKFNKNGELTINNPEFYLGWDLTFDGPWISNLYGKVPHHDFFEVEIIDDDKIYETFHANSCGGSHRSYEFEELTDGSEIKIEITPILKEFLEVNSTDLIVNVKK